VKRAAFSFIAGHPVTAAAVSLTAITLSEDAMFADTLDSSWGERSRRGWTTLTSFGLQALLVGLLLCLPWLRPDVVPFIHKLATPISLGSPSPEPVAQPHAAGGGGLRPHVVSPMILMTPRWIPVGTSHAADVVAPPGIDAGVGISSDRVGIPGGALFSAADGVRPVIPPAPPAITHTVRISQISEGDLVHKIQPVYPPIARRARIEGRVLLEAVISEEGRIEKLHVVSGQPMLVQAAIEAVSQWRYRPYLLNNEPVEVETQITVNFTLSRN
jgi:periplasmic protein TonB